MRLRGPGPIRAHLAERLLFGGRKSCSNNLIAGNQRDLTARSQRQLCRDARIDLIPNGNDTDLPLVVPGTRQNSMQKDAVELAIPVPPRRIIPLVDGPLEIGLCKSGIPSILGYMQSIDLSVRTG